MQSLKTAIVLVTLLGVGYGVHVVLNQPTVSNDDSMWNIPGSVELPAGVSDTNPIFPSAVNDHSVASATPTTGSVPQGMPPAYSPPGMPTETPMLSGSSAAAVNATAATQGPPPSSSWGAVPSGISTPPPAFAPTSGGSPAPSPSPTGPSPGEVVATSLAAPTGVGMNQAPAPLSPSATCADPACPGGEVNRSSPLTTTESSAGTQVSALAFDVTWSDIVAKVDRGQLVEALLAASVLYQDRNLTTAQYDQLLGLLDQLAGTVIYSPEHHLDRAYTVVAGDTWDSISARYQVPPGFLCRVNGLPENLPPPPGQSLKVVTGPFRAEVNLTRRELTLYLGHYYAGRFNVGIGRDLPEGYQVLQIHEKGGGRDYLDPRSGQSIPAHAPENPYGRFWIGLLSSAGTTSNPLAIHSVGPGVDASDTRGCITVSDRDADDLMAILSVGSKVTVLR